MKIPSCPRARCFLGACLLASLASWASLRAAPSLSVAQTSYSNLLPGQSFSVQINLENPDPITIVAYDFFVRASHAGIFSITAQALSGNVDQPNSLASLPHEVTTSDTNDFGAYNSSGTSGFGTGTFTAQTLTFQVNPAATAGDYLLNLGWNQPSLTGGASLLDSDLNEYQMGAPIGISVAVVPEPGATALLITGGLVGMFALRRRLAARRS